jgi:hypothetical protein
MAVVMLEAAGYPNRLGAVAEVADHLKMPHNTLRDWAKNKHGAPGAKVRNEKKGELVGLLKAAAIALVTHLVDIAGTGDVRETATALGIVVDKLQILSGEPTENINQRIIVEYFDDTDSATTPADLAGASDS